MMRFSIFRSLLCGIFLASATSAEAQGGSNPLPVFPAAAGFGTTTPAGSGRHLNPPQTSVYKVTSLADTGAGTLRDCVKRAVPRVCVFEISGRIQLATEILVDKPYLTIAGQTAPSPGILIAGAGIRVATNDVLIQHLQILVGDAKKGPKPQTRDALNVAGKSGSIAKNVVLDHLSLGWGVDENFDIWYPTTSDVTLSNSIVAEALYKSIHPKGPHSMGVLIGKGAKRISLHHNLIAHNYDRNPRIEYGAQAEFISNVVYNWGGSSSWNQANLSDTENTGVPVELAFVGNYYRPGKSSPKGATIYGKPPAAKSRIYALSNFGPSRMKETLSEWALSMLPESSFRVMAPSFALSGVTPSSATETWEEVLTTAGSRPKESNPVDKRIVSEVTLSTGTIKDCVSGCSRSAGGYPAMAVVSRPVQLPANPNEDDDRNGYTNLEDWLHELALSVE